MFVVVGESGGTHTRVARLSWDGTTLNVDKTAVSRTGSGTILPTSAAVQSWREAWDALGVDEDPAAVCLSHSGPPDPAATAWYEVSTTDPLLVPDAVVPIFAVSPEGTGRSAVIGTGARAVQVRDGVVVASSSGWGWYLGEEGSAVWIGQQIVRSALTTLEVGDYSEVCLLLARRLGLAALTAEDLFRHVYRSGVPTPLAVAPFALLVEEFPAVSELADIAAAAAGHVRRMVWAVPGPGPLTITGSVAAGVVGQRVVQDLPEPVIVQRHGLAGAAVAALARAGVPQTPALLEHAREVLDVV